MVNKGAPVSATLTFSGWVTQSTTGIRLQPLKKPVVT